MMIREKASKEISSKIQSLFGNLQLQHHIISQLTDNILNGSQ